MKCPTCAYNTPDSWETLVQQMSVGFRVELPDPDPDLRDERVRTRQLHFDWMHCANESCAQLVVRGHETYTDNSSGFPLQKTDTWVVHPRHASRPLDPLIAQTAEGLARDYAEAVAILDISHRMAAVLARSILADLLEDYAGLTDFGLAARVDKFIDDASRPFNVREQLHYLREIADLSAHTKKNDQLEQIEITREEADWTLSVVERLFDYFIVSPAKSASLKKGIDAKLDAAGRKPIKPLQPDPEIPSEPDEQESA